MWNVLTPVIILVLIAVSFFMTCMFPCALYVFVRGYRERHADEVGASAVMIVLCLLYFTGLYVWFTHPYFHAR